MHRRQILALPLLALLPARALAGTPVLRVVVDISDQRMRVYQGDTLLHDWPVSTARKGKRTPVGDFRPQWLSKNHRSSLYDDAPMPNSIFFSGNYAIHGTYETNKLGRRASAGCVRLANENAAILFNHVDRYGNGSLRIRIRS